MKRAALLILVLAFPLTLTSCGGNKNEESSNKVTYSKCIETEAAKLLDETGSNLDYANEMAAKACEGLK